MCWRIWSARSTGEWARRTTKATTKTAATRARSRLVNRSTGRVLAADARLARSLRAQLLGLIGRAIGGDEALGLPRCSCLHTFFVRQPLDAVFCDAAGRVLAIRADVRPFTIVGRPGAALVWEARAGVLAPFVRTGDVLGLEDGAAVVWDTG